MIRSIPLLLLISIVLAPPSPATSPETPPPNILLFLADDLGWKDLGCYGSTFHETPAIDRLAGEGIRFTDAYASSPVCAPTRASILSGRCPARTGVVRYGDGQSFGAEQTTIAELLKERGYRTGYLGKWHLGSSPEEQGFTHVDACPAPASGMTIRKGHLNDAITEGAVRFLDETGGDPFFLFVSYFTVHLPLNTSADLEEKYLAKRLALDGATEARFEPEHDRRNILVQDNPLYAGMMEELDGSVGIILEKLEQLGAAGNTVVIFTSDNGGLSTKKPYPTSNAPLRAGKGWLYEGGIRVPLIIRPPGSSGTGGVTSMPTISSDLFPTLLEAAGLPPRPDLHADGISLMPLLLGSAPPRRDALYWRAPYAHGGSGSPPSAAVRKGDYKLIRFLETGEAELYYLKSDPGERTDLIEQEPALANELLEMLRRRHDELGISQGD